MEPNRYEILKQTGTTFNLPLYLESSVDEMGVMVGFDGEVQQVDQIVNFTYSGATGSKAVTLYSTTNPDKLRKIVDQDFTVDWGDGSVENITNSSQGNHTYGGGLSIVIVTIIGTINGWSFNSVSTSRNQIKSVNNFGNLILTNGSFLKLFVNIITC